ncbi:transcriptional regulator [Sphaerochaeta pleomorpha str. Grapes]|uniref:Transcriptional regulator n=1 Tax=Sphaerochaeta pleomorpha (strain ATCC BAA-1885 / DSM 22778 / Grapes) TaxID=158190 RepID=G8QSE5_SPHPG|nr:TetR/AcrR family transcriptional regulator [Sphaerochaeta pleomorpha]AEV30075.1 transcriptional regulator [Sphaerochaeta pleomorpha str. Grapes]
MAKNTKQQIIDATLGLLAVHPLEPLTMDEIARKVGICKPAIYRHFASKQELLETIDKTVTNDFGALFAHIDPAKANDIRYLLTTFTESFLLQRNHFAFIVHLMIARHIDVSHFLKRLFVYPGCDDSDFGLLYRSSLYSYIASSDIRNDKLFAKDVQLFVEKILGWYSHGLGIFSEIEDPVWQEALVGKEEIEEDRFLVSMDKVANTYGLDGLTMQRIAKELHLASSSIYYSFPTKEALVSETACKEQLQFLTILDRKLLNAKDIRQALQILFSASGSYISKRPRLAVQFIVLSCFHDKGIPSQFLQLRYWSDQLSLLQENAGNLCLFMAIAPQFKYFCKSADPLDWMNDTKKMYRYFTSGCVTEES